MKGKKEKKTSEIHGMKHLNYKQTNRATKLKKMNLKKQEYGERRKEKRKKKKTNLKCVYIRCYKKNKHAYNVLLLC